MLQNGLGDLLVKEARSAHRFVDLFSGSSAISWHVAENIKKLVLAVDLQLFAASLAGSILERTKPVDGEKLWVEWEARSEKWLTARFNGAFKTAQSSENDFAKKLLRRQVVRARKFCSRIRKAPVTHAYGGYYYSPLQALWIDALRATLPAKKDEQDVALAALIEAASACAAAPGHTAQPFGNTKTARQWIHEAWKRDVLVYTKRMLYEFADRHALTRGAARTGDANSVAKRLKRGDLVFVDPPYSGVHYSRFYHVLETIARGRLVKVSGTGRYPPIEQRPHSRYSTNGQSKEALEDLLSTLARKQVRVILTFPAGQASNNLSGRIVRHLAEKYFIMRRKTVKTRFSTLGGNLTHRESHRSRGELILVLKPRRGKVK